MDLGILLLRLVVGGVMIGHGAQKLFGWFGGHGVRGTAGFLESMGYRPAKPLAVVHGAAEAGGGLLLVLGLMTPLGAAAIAGVLVAAIVSVHWGNGIWNEKGGSEFPLVLATAALTAAFVGPGRFSIDSALGHEFAGTAWGLGAIALAMAAAAGVLLARASAKRETASPTANEGTPSEARAA